MVDFVIARYNYSCYGLVVNIFGENSLTKKKNEMFKAHPSVSQ